MIERFVQVRNVSKIYIDGKKSLSALKDVSFDVDEGECIAIVGPSGCGKTTLVKMIAGLITPTEGEIIIGGRLVRGPSSDIGMVFQEPALLPWRHMINNILLPLEILRENGGPAEERARSLIKLVGLEGFEHRYPYELSGGMQQRVALCRALIHNPSLLLLDEPFGALDAITREQLNFELLKLLEYHRKTAIFVTHSIPEAIFLADRVIVMGPRPAGVIKIIPNRLSHPRDPRILFDSDFTALTLRVRSLMDAAFLNHRQ